MMVDGGSVKIVLKGEKDMKIKTLVKFSGVPKDTTGEAERDGDQWKITWDLDRTKPLVDWFDESEFKQYLEVFK